VIKRDGRREQFSREKVRSGILKACEKRPVALMLIDETIDEIEREIHREEGREVTTAKIGEMVMDRLQEVDKIAYIRFASVYRKFENISEFVKEIKEITIGG
jgi:transcriptional repressor NrdR